MSTESDNEPEIVITDTGVGIPREDLPHVFDRFFRSQTSVDMAVEGSGLGLMIVKSIIEAHHGSIHVDSEPGVGTTVRLTLPKG